VEELLGLSFVQPDQAIESPHACQISKRSNLTACCGRGGAKGTARCAGQHDSPIIIMPPPANDERRCPTRRWNAARCEIGDRVPLRIGAALPQMKAPCSGHIINVRSVAGRVVRPGSAVHAATKTAVRVISEGLRPQVKPYNIRTTTISPGAGHRTARRRDRAGRGAEPV
jgi:short chain dehydrogenase